MIKFPKQLLFTMIYSTTITEVLALCKDFLTSLDSEVGLISHSQYEKIDFFHISNSDFPILVNHINNFLTEHPKYSVSARISLETKTSDIDLISKNFFSSKNILKNTEKYKSLRSFINTLNSSKINHLNYFLYKHIHDYPISDDTIIEINYDEESKTFGLDLMGISALIQKMDFPGSIFDKNFSDKEIYIRIQGNAPQEITKNLVSLKNTNVLERLFLSTPVNIYKLLDNKHIFNSPKESENDYVPFFNTLNSSNYYESLQVEVYERFNQNPELFTKQILSFLGNSSTPIGNISLFVSDEPRQEIFQHSKFLVPILPDISILKAFFIGANFNIDNIVSNLLNNNSEIDDLFLSIILNIISEKGTIFITPSLDNILESELFAKKFPDPLIEKTVKDNIAFAMSIIESFPVSRFNVKTSRYIQFFVAAKNHVYSSSNDYSKNTGLVNLFTLFYNHEIFSKVYRNLPSISDLSNKIKPDVQVKVDNIILQDIDTYLLSIYKKNQVLFFNHICENINIQNFDLTQIKKTFHEILPHKNISEIIETLIVSPDHVQSLIGIALLGYLEKKHTANFNYTNEKTHHIFATLLKSPYQEKSIFLVTTLYDVLGDSFIFNLPQPFQKELAFYIFKNLNYSSLLANPNTPILWILEASTQFDSPQFSNTKNPNIFQLLQIDDENVNNFICKYPDNFISLHVPRLSITDVNKILELSCFNKSFINNIIRSEDKRFQTQEYLDLFLDKEPKSFNNISNYFPTYLLQLPNNINKMLRICNENNFNSKAFLTKISPEIYAYGIIQNMDLTTLNNTIISLIEEALMETATVAYNYNNLSNKVVKF